MKSSRKICTAAAIGVFVVLLAHGIWLFIAKGRFEAMISQRTGNYSMSYEKNSARPSLFGIRNSVSDFKISISSQQQIYDVVLKKLIVKGSMFNRKYTVSIPEGAVFSAENSAGIRMDLVDDSIVIIANKKNLLMPETDVEIRKIRFSGVEVGGIKDFCVANNFSLRTTSDLNKDRIESLIKMNIDSIKTKKNVKNLESNFEMTVSGVSDIGSDGKVIAMDVKIGNIIVNDITNNYGISLAGGIKISQLPRMGLLDIEFKLVNFNSLVEALNNSDSEFVIFDRNTMFSFIQTLGLIPKNEKDTDSLRHYRVISDFISKKVTVNDMDSEAIVKKLLLINNENKEETGDNNVEKKEEKNENKGR
ncbi:MAG: hypothetical protein LBI29_03870 [Rickettsiales bacterium]|nr:hypothetical protein [Rickettsiales bacterium]